MHRVNNQLPWPYQKTLPTLNAQYAKPIIMGRKTYESIGRPLPGRANIAVVAMPICKLLVRKL